MHMNATLVYNVPSLKFISLHWKGLSCYYGSCGMNQCETPDTTVRLCNWLCGDGFVPKYALIDTWQYYGIMLHVVCT